MVLSGLTVVGAMVFILARIRYIVRYKRSYRLYGVAE